MLDTDAQQQAEYYARLRALSVEQRARILSSLCQGVRTVAEAGIRHANPALTDAQVREELTYRLYGRAVADRLHGR